MTKETQLYLASQSPRRSELLTQVGISFALLNVDVDESIFDNEGAEEYVIRLAKDKAIAGWNSETDKKIPVLGSDTSVVINGNILGKPKDHHDAVRMLKSLSGATHQVMTAVALAQAPDNPPNSTSSTQAELSSVLSVSDVSFKTLSQVEIEQYVSSGECDDKAGAYAIQGLAATFITHLSGSFSGVMGLPIYETSELLKNAGIRADFLVVS